MRRPHQRVGLLDEEEGDAEWLRIEIGLIELAAEEYGRLPHRIAHRVAYTETRLYV